MIEVAFKYDLDEDYGMSGWMPEAQPDFNANEPNGVAHDVLDHHDLRDGSVEGELRAFGAMLFSRGETGHMARSDAFGRPADWHMGYALGSVLRDKWASWQLELTIPNAGQRALGDDAEELLRLTVQRAIKSLREEADYKDDEEDDFESFVFACQEALPRYMRFGYRQVQRRFRADGFGIADLYDQIANHKLISKHYEPEERARLVIKIEPRTLKLDVDVQLYEDPHA